MEPSDQPIESPHEDVLGRKELVKGIANVIASVDSSRGAVVGILGPWGSGKTSLINLARRALVDDKTVLDIFDFNPWLFSGADSLATMLLVELAGRTQVLQGESRAKSKEWWASVNDRLVAYAEATSLVAAIPGIGGIHRTFADTTKGLRRLLDVPPTARRNAAARALGKLGGRIAIVIDDVDRLAASEVADLFRTVRLGASFPNVVYVVCCDPDIVAPYLGTSTAQGHAFLEKIFTATIAVPAITPVQAMSIFRARLDELLDDLGVVRDWKMDGVEQDIVRPLMRSIRDVKRLSASLYLPLSMLHSSLPASDIVGLEALRTLAPQFHSEVLTNGHHLTLDGRYIGDESRGGALRTDEEERSLAAIRSFADRDAYPARAALKRLFPVAWNLLTGERAKISDVEGHVAIPEGFEYYVTHQTSDYLEASRMFADWF